MKKRGPFVWKGKVAGGLFGVLAGPFGIFFGFLIGHLVDLLLESIRIRKQVSLFLAHPESSDISRVEDGVFPFFCMAGTLILAQGKGLKDRTNDIIEKLRLYFPVRDSDYKHFDEICEALESFESTPNIRSHARVVRELNPDFDPILEGLRALGGLEGRECLTEPVVALLREIAVEWDIGGELFFRLLGLTDTRSGNPWVVLGLEPGAGEEELKKVFRVLASNFHPDGASGLSDLQRKETEEAFKRIRRAYEECLREITHPPA